MFCFQARRLSSLLKEVSGSKVGLDEVQQPQEEHDKSTDQDPTTHELVAAHLPLPAVGLWLFHLVESSSGSRFYTRIDYVLVFLLKANWSELW